MERGKCVLSGDYMEKLQYYIKKFSGLKVDRSKGSPAPHKAIMLLSVIQSVRSKEIIGNKIAISPELVARFRENWSLLVHNDNFKPNFALPFFHLKTEGFWQLHTYPGREVILTSSNSIKSFSSLRDTFSHASLSEELFLLLLDPETSAMLEAVLLRTYFPETTKQPTLYAPSLFERIEDKILRESPVAYRAEIEQIDEEEIFVRGGVFKKVVPRIYNQTCCVSGLRIVAGDIQMIDACHIVPFAESHDDTISNGISLCPNLHRAFDRYLITIDEEYRVVVSNQFVEQPDYLRVFSGKPIALPKKRNHFPSQENLQVHRERFGRVNG
jgi:putative restriction endonuclease